MRRQATIVAAAVSAALLTGGVMVGGARAAAALKPAASIAKSADGHFWAEAEVNGETVRVLVDTGASAVALTPADARRLGLDPDRLLYTRQITTAGGGVRAAPVELDHVTVGGARVEHVSALVVDKGLSASLLGMSYLGRLSGFAADRGALVLKR